LRRQAPLEIEEECMKFLLAFARDREKMYDASEEEMKEAMEAWNAFNKEAIDAGVLIANEALELPEEAKTVRVSAGGDQTVIDGPFTETKEQLGGFCLIDCASLNEAIGWAKKVPIGDGAIEVRQVKDLSEYGYDSGSPGLINA
jgi:hypothetical protein